MVTIVMDFLSIRGFVGVAFLCAVIVASWSLAKFLRKVARSDGLKVIYEDQKLEIE